MQEEEKKTNCSRKGPMTRSGFLALAGALGGGLLLNPLHRAFAMNDKTLATPPAWSSSTPPAWPIAVEGDELVIPAGSYPAEHGAFIVKKTARIRISPASIGKAEGEELQLSKDKPSGYWVGTPLKASRSGQLGVYCSLIEDSLVMKDAKGYTLKKGDDYLVSAPFSLVGLGTNTTLTPADKVYASYSYYLQRVDTIALDEQGTPFLTEGSPALVCPRIPSVAALSRRLLNVYRPVAINTLKEEHLFPLLASPEHPVTTGSTPGRIKKTLHKLRSGQPVSIVAWGDSITAEADVPPGGGWPSLFHKVLQERFPKADIRFSNHSIGGTRSMQWLHDGNYPGLQQYPANVCSFKLVLDEKPDLIVMEFTNDTVEDPEKYADNYEIIRRELDRLGCELVIHTPGRFSINQPEVNVADMKKPETRPYVSFVKKFADENHFAISDVAARWEHFWKEGLPYMAILINGYNHPDTYGHAIFVEELMKCFDENYITGLPEYM
jgi:lysophospholipase L1-like esterase